MARKKSTALDRVTGETTPGERDEVPLLAVHVGHARIGRARQVKSLLETLPWDERERSRPERRRSAMAKSARVHLVCARQARGVHDRGGSQTGQHRALTGHVVSPGAMVDFAGYPQ